MTKVCGQQILKCISFALDCCFMVVSGSFLPCVT